ncbi:MAG: glycosyltransferase family 4 protein [Dehalococcoidia bacterium]|nr:glycosyltransferase family 4 protein [Dehalococcoidia bacterium]
MARPGARRHARHRLSTALVASRMRIAEINDIASVATDLAEGLRARGHQVTVMRPRLFGGSLPWMVKPVVGPVRAVEWAQIIREVHAGHFDMVHIHYAYLGMLGVLGKFPYILHCHGSDVREITPFTRPMIERALRQAGRVFYATPDLADYVLERRPDAEFLPNPVDVQLFRPLAPARESRAVFVCCALTPIKGAQRILDACRRLAALRPDIQVTAIRGGEYTAAFEALPNVTLIPRQPRGQLPDVVARHGVVLGQALLGAAGMAELEAMAAARPVVTWFRYNRAYPEPPPLIRAVDGYDIAQAVIRLVDGADEREGVGLAARAWVQRYHDVDSVAARVEAAACSLIAEQAARAAS